MKTLLAFSLAALTFSTAQVNATGIGKEIRKCLYQSGVRGDSPNFLRAAEACEKIVMEMRAEKERREEELQLKAALKTKACLAEQTDNLDDGISPAGDIARAISMQCVEPWNTLLNAAGEGWLKGTKESLRQLENVALVYVLTNRKKTKR